MRQCEQSIPPNTFQYPEYLPGIDVKHPNYSSQDSNQDLELQETRIIFQDCESGNPKCSLLVDEALV
jgi:hypothetical protein